MPNILIYRHQLFKYSETFIPPQAQTLQHYQPIYVGREMFGQSPKGAIVETINSCGRFNVFKQRLFRCKKPVINMVERYRPVLIHAHFGVEGVYALPIAKALHIPVITTFHGFDATIRSRDLLYSMKPAWINYLLFRRQLAREGDLFLCVSDFIRGKVLNLGFPKERTIKHYIGVDTKSIQPLSQASTEKIVLHVARLVEKKGTEYLLKAFSKIIKDGIRAKLIIIGDGILYHNLIVLTHALEIDKHVSFLGSKSHDEVLEWMRKASVFCLPSVTAYNGDSEGLGMVLLEAGAIGIPSIGTWHGGIPEGVRDNNTGFLVPERDENALADRLKILLKNDNICREMGMNARRFVEENFNLRKQTEKLEKIYESLL